MNDNVELKGKKDHPMLDTTTTKALVYEIGKQYVSEIHPELYAYFDSIWEYFNENETSCDESTKKDKHPGLGFLLDPSILEVIKIVLPFISGVVSSVLAEMIIQKSGVGNRDLLKITKKKGDEVAVGFRMKKEKIKEILPIMNRVLLEQRSYRSHLTPKHTSKSRDTQHKQPA